ncbi:MAG: ATPase domain-containing protein, partial [bacterium]|nr:ATPase domain-containing protein [bacterium]
MLPNLITSGNPQLDELLGGGIIRNRIYFISGQSGTGKTTLGVQLLSSETRSDGTRLLISFRDLRLGKSTPKVRGSPKTTKKGQTPILFKYIPVLHLNRTKTLTQLKKIISTAKPTRLMIDDIHLLSAIPEMNLRAFWELAELCRRYAEISIVTGTSNPQPHHSPVDESPLFEFADGVICLRYDEHPDRINKKIFVLKHRELQHDPAVRLYTFTADGILILKKPPSPAEKPRETKKEITASPLPETTTAVIPDMLYFDAEQEKMVLRRIADYNAQHPESPVQILDKKIESVYDYNILIEKFEKGETPFTLLPLDVYRLPQFAEKGLIYPLDNFFSPQLRELYLDVALQQCIYKGVIYAIPQYINVGILA